MRTDLSPPQQRAHDPLLRAALSFPALVEKLPLSLPVPPDTPPSPKRHYRSHYVYLGHQELRDPAVWPLFSLFDLALHLIDFSSLEAPLAQMVYQPSARGHPPFHPVSLFLLHTWRITHHWPRTTTLTNLAAPRYADYRHRFGFADGVYPTEGGLRDFERRLGAQSGTRLIAATVELARALQCISAPALQHGILSVDGMLHDAAAHVRCTAVDASCYAAAPRPCRAKEKERKGCDCQESACARVCKQATPRDPQARFIVYQGHTRPDSPNAVTADAHAPKPVRGTPRYGYRSVCARLIDPLRRCSWVLTDALLPATDAEDQTATALMRDVVTRYDWVTWAFVVADAGEGRDPFLSTAYQLGLRRVVGLRAIPGDADVASWSLRGYDDKGTPVCPHGYRLHPNGWDRDRRRHKWCCRRTCERETAHPAPDCPHRSDGDKHGLVRDVGRSFPDGSTRLVRDVPHGSPLATQLYGRARNAAEERNSVFQGLGLKRMPVYGFERVRAQVTTVDMWVNLNTLMRLTREAVCTATGLSPPEDPQ